jgi:hypothetical protein
MSLADALQHVVKNGTNESEAKLDLCRAMADQKIDVRIRIATTGAYRNAQIYMGGGALPQVFVNVPVHLDPSDFDWVSSRPLGWWRIDVGKNCYFFPIDLIELATAHVTAVLIEPLAKPHEPKGQTSVVQMSHDSSDTHTGAPGRPTSIKLVEREIERLRLMGEGNQHSSIEKWSVHLSEWLEITHPNAPHMTPKTIKNNLRQQIKWLMGGPKSSPK